jgi:regulator of nucleoside diphosphate kinase
MAERRIYISDRDLQQLEQLVFGPQGWGSGAGWVREGVQVLAEELERALVVPAADIPDDVVAMRSEVRVIDLAAGEERTLTLVYPIEADPARDRISVLAPIGTALLGYRVGDTVTWRGPGGVRRFRIDAILHQPEAAERR